MEEEVCNVGREGFWTIPIKNGNGGISVDDGVPKVNLRRGKVENRGNTEGNEAKGLEVRE